MVFVSGTAVGALWSTCFHTAHLRKQGYFTHETAETRAERLLIKMMDEAEKWIDSTPKNDNDNSNK